MLYSYMVRIYILIYKRRIFFKILNSVNKELLKLTSISTIIKQQEWSFGTYNKNMNCDSDASRHIYKIKHWQ